MIFVGVDWAEAHHDVHVADEDGKRLGRGRLPEGVEGIARFHELVGAHVEDPAEVVIGIETDRGLFVAALVAAGYQVFAVNPMSTSRYRDRHSTSGAKSDPGDAKVLADMVRTDRHNHRPGGRRQRDGRGGQGPGPGPSVHGLVEGPPDQPVALHPARVLPGRPGRLRRPGQRRRPRSAAHRPHPELGRTLSRSKIAAALRRGGRQRRIDERAGEIQAALRLRPARRARRRLDAPWGPRWPPAWP